MISGAVIGRDAELDFVEGFLDEVGGGPTGLVLSGEAGIGKTVLWRVGVDNPRSVMPRVQYEISPIVVSPPLENRNTAGTPTRERSPFVLECNSACSDDS